MDKKVWHVLLQNRHTSVFNWIWKYCKIVVGEILSTYLWNTTTVYLVGPRGGSSIPAVVWTGGLVGGFERIETRSGRRGMMASTVCIITCSCLANSAVFGMLSCDGGNACHNNMYYVIIYQTNCRAAISINKLFWYALQPYPPYNID